MKRKILVPMFASVMALSMGATANADNIKTDNENIKSENSNSTIELGELKEEKYKLAAIKDGVAVKIREEGKVKTIAYTGDEFKVVATQGEWVKVALADGEGWVPARYVDLKQAKGYVTGTKVNFRKESNVEAEIITELEIGNAVEVIEQNEEWVKVKNGEEEGYVSALYLSEDAPVIEVEEEVVVENSSTESNTTTDNNTNNNTTTNNNTNSNNTTTDNNAGSSNSESNSSNTQKPVEKPEENNDANPPVSSSQRVQAVLNLAYSKQGSPYVWGAEGPNSFDCSGFTYYVYKNAAGVNLPRTSSAQSGVGSTVSKANLQPGDLVFFNTSGKGVSHVGIYVGGGNMIHSPSSGKTVSVVSINSSYYSSKFVTAKRVL